MEPRKRDLEPVFGRFLRVWKIGGSIRAASCVRARVRGGGVFLRSILPFVLEKMVVLKGKAL